MEAQDGALSLLCLLTEPRLGRRKRRKCGKKQNAGSKRFLSTEKTERPPQLPKGKAVPTDGAAQLQPHSVGGLPPKQGRPARATEKEATARHLRHKGPQPHSLLEVSARLCPAHILGKEMSMGRVTGDT